MASSITLKTDLDSFIPVWNKMEICAYETDAPTLALTDYKYLFDIYIEGVSSFRRFEVIPAPTTSYGAVDISRYCQGYVYNALSDPTSTVPFLMGATGTGEASVIKVTVKYGYSYMNAGVYTVVADTVTGSAKYAWNASLDFKQWIQFDYNDFICNIINGVNGQWLTDMKSHNVSLANAGRMCILTDTPTDIDKVVYVTYNSAGATIATNIKAITVSQALTTSRMYQVATAPDTINNMTGVWVSGGPNPIITSSVASYDIFLVDTAGNVASETISFFLEEPCRYEQRRLHFVNKYGSWEQFNFNLKSTERREIERKGFKYDKYPITSNGISRHIYDQAQITNYVSTQDFISLKSDFITEDQNTWLKQLIESPEIYLEITDDAGDQTYYAVETIVGTSWSEKQTINDKLFSLECEIKLSQKNIRQGR
jgi:hypothetical protein